MILLHPGSSTLHLGLATTRTPHSLPHLIAYRGSEGGGGSGEGERKGTIPEDGSLVLRHEAEITVSGKSYIATVFTGSDFTFIGQ